MTTHETTNSPQQPPLVNLNLLAESRVQLLFALISLTETSLQVFNFPPQRLLFRFGHVLPLR